MISHGDGGEGVRRLQRGLGVEPDGIFGEETERALRTFQAEEGLGVDGVFGPGSWARLLRRCIDEDRLREVWPKRAWVRLELSERVKPLVKRGVSYDRINIREDFAPALQAALDDFEAAGCVLTTSGSKRRLKERVTATRSVTSMHYIGRAFDLGVYSGARDPDNDPLLVAEDAELRGVRQWRIFARADNPSHPLVEKRVLRVLSAKARGLVEIEALVVDVTARLASAGFVGIGARSKSWAAPLQHYPGTEWWHFQIVEGLEVEQSTFGDELLTMFDLEELRGMGPWGLRSAEFGKRFK